MQFKYALADDCDLYRHFVSAHERANVQARGKIVLSCRWHTRAHMCDTEIALRFSSSSSDLIFHARIFSFLKNLCGCHFFSQVGNWIQVFVIFYFRWNPWKKNFAWGVLEVDPKWEFSFLKLLLNYTFIFSSNNGKFCEFLFKFPPF